MRRGAGGGRAGLKVEKGEYLVLPDRPAQAAAIIIEPVVVTVQATIRWGTRVIRTDSIPALISVQPWP